MLRFVIVALLALLPLRPPATLETAALLGRLHELGDQLDTVHATTLTLGQGGDYHGAGSWCLSTLADLLEADRGILSDITEQAPNSDPLTVGLLLGVDSRLGFWASQAGVACGRAKRARSGEEFQQTLDLGSRRRARARFVEEYTRFATSHGLAPYEAPISTRGAGE